MLHEATQHGGPIDACHPSSIGRGALHFYCRCFTAAFYDNSVLSWQAVGGSVPALQSVHLGAAQMQDLMPSKPAAKRSFKAKADARPAVVLPPDNDEPFVPPAAILKR